MILGETVTIEIPIPVPDKVWTWWRDICRRHRKHEGYYAAQIIAEEMMISGALSLVGDIAQPFELRAVTHQRVFFREADFKALNRFASRIPMKTAKACGLLLEHACRTRKASISAAA